MSVSCRQTEGDVSVVTARGRLDQSLNPELERLLSELLAPEVRAG